MTKGAADSYIDIALIARVSFGDCSGTTTSSGGSTSSTSSTRSSSSSSYSSGNLNGMSGAIRVSFGGCCCCCCCCSSSRSRSSSYSSRKVNGISAAISRIIRRLLEIPSGLPEIDFNAGYIGEEGFHSGD